MFILAKDREGTRNSVAEEGEKHLPLALTRHRAIPFKKLRQNKLPYSLSHGFPQISTMVFRLQVLAWNDAARSVNAGMLPG
jgi:hypothetical protein